MNSYSATRFYVKVREDLMLPYESVLYALTVIDHAMRNVKIF